MTNEFRQVIQMIESKVANYVEKHGEARTFTILKKLRFSYSLEVETLTATTFNTICEDKTFKQIRLYELMIERLDTVILFYEHLKVFPKNN